MVTIEGFWRAHQIPLPDVATNKEHLALLESWMKSYKPEQLFADYGKLIPECRALVPPRDKRMSGNPQTNGGHRTALHLPPFRDYALSVNPGITSAGSMGNMAKWTRPARMGEYLPKDDPALSTRTGDRIAWVSISRGTTRFLGPETAKEKPITPLGFLALILVGELPPMMHAGTPR
jgi:hypothetical protein